MGVLKRAVEDVMDRRTAQMPTLRRGRIVAQRGRQIDVLLDGETYRNIRSIMPMDGFVSEIRGHHVWVWMDRMEPLVIGLDSNGYDPVSLRRMVLWR